MEALATHVALRYATDVFKEKKFDL